jgi:thiol-disulfide isomerase/thioredoxin
MSQKLKNTYCGQSLNNKLKIVRISSINGYLPNATLLEYNGIDYKLDFNGFETKYLLVDFWASYCAPCIKQFPYLLELYNVTSRDYFDIIAISIDENKTIKNWNSLLEKQNLPWKQYLDEKGFAKQLFINSVPANFLLNKKGQIILRDFTVDELKEFLEFEKTDN